MAGITTEQYHEYCTPDQEHANPMLRLLTLAVATPATDLTINSVIQFQRVKVMIACNNSDSLVFWGDSPLSYAKNNASLFLFATTAL